MGRSKVSSEQLQRVLERISDPLRPPPHIAELSILAFGRVLKSNEPGYKSLKRVLANGTKPSDLPTENLLQVKEFFEQKKHILPTQGTAEPTRVPMPDLADIPVQLSEPQRTTVESHAATMDAKELAEMVFGDVGAQEIGAVASHLKTLDAPLFSNPGEFAAETYSPPETLPECIARIKKFTREPLHEDKLSQKQRKDIDSLIGHLHVLRFTHQMSTYLKAIDRDLFESTFIRHVWSKASDITNEECDIFIIVAAEAVIEANIKRRIENLQSMMDDTVKEAKDDNKKRISMSLVEAIGALQSEYNECVKRQERLLANVTGKRSERIKNRVAENQSLVSLMEFARNSDNRKHLQELAEQENKKLNKEVDRLRNMDDLELQIFGISPRELGLDR